MLNLTIDWQRFETVFMDEKISMLLYPLKRSAIIKLAPFLSGLTDAKEDTVLSFKDASELLDLAKDIFPDHVKDVSGIRVNGADVTIGHLVEEGIFLNLNFQIITRLFNISFLDKEQEKNLKKQSGQKD